MIRPLAAFVRNELLQHLPDHVAHVAGLLADRTSVSAVIFYGSNLRTGSADGVLDFYVLTDGLIERGPWPTVSYREFALDSVMLRAKIATMTTATFSRAACGEGLDTTIWTRFVQPCALAFARDDTASATACSAVADAIRSAARVAAVAGPAIGTPDAFWRALFRETYRAEFRFEGQARADTIVAHAPARYAELLPLAWAADGIAFDRDADGRLVPRIDLRTRWAITRHWRLRRAFGKPINLARLAKAAFTFDGAARYALWKIERHTGVTVALTPWRERHPILAAPGVVWRVWRRSA